MREFNICDCQLTTGKPIIIEASAGTGKTTAIENLFIRLLTEGVNAGTAASVPEINQILVVTFTEAATAELIMRIRAKITRAINHTVNSDDTILQEILTKAVESRGAAETQLRLKMALENFDDSSICTIHGFCARMLHEFAVESGTAPDTELITDDSELFRETAADFYRSFFLQPGKELQCIIATQNNFTLSAIEKFARTVMKNPDCAVADRDEIAPTDSFEQQFTEIIQQFLEIIDYFLSDYYANQEVFKTDLKKTLAIVCSSLSKYKSDFIQIGRIFCTLANVNFESGKLQKCSWKTKNQILPESFARINELAQKYSAIVEKYIRSIKLAFIEYSRRPDTMAAKKRLRQVNTFDDLLVNTQQALQNNPAFAQRIRQRFKVVMIDEFQDTDPVQYYIFNTVFNHPEALMLVVGDPKQSIYSFRGADIYSYLGAVKKISDTDVYSLTRNYRSSQQLLDSFNNLFNHSNPFIEQKITYHNATAGREIGQLVVEKSNYFNAPLEFCNVFDPNKQKGNRGRAGKNALAETVARVAELLHRANQLNHQGQPRARFEFNGKFVPVKASDIAILTDTNREAIILRELLSRVGVPAVMQNSGKIFATNEASELYHILKAVLNPANKKMLFSALITSCFSLDAAAIDALNTSEGDNEQLESYRLKFCLLQEIWLTKGFMPMFFKLQEDNVHRIALPAMLERHLTDLAHLAELLHQASRTRQLGPEGLINWLQERIAGAADDDGEEEYEQRLESDDAAVKILTVHRSKGLQFPIVFCPSVWRRGFVKHNNQAENDFFFHRENAAQDGYELCLEITGEKSPTPNRNNLIQYRREKLAETIRLFYVAVTRAEYYCWIAHGQDQETSDHALSYLRANFPGSIDEYLFDGTLPADAERLQYPYSDSLCCYQFEPGADVEFYTAPCRQVEFSNRDFTGTIQRDFRIMSYSSLTAGEHEQDFSPGTEELLAVDSSKKVSAAELDETQPEFADFPPGAHSGDCVHAVFENFDFALIKRPGWQELPNVKILMEQSLIKFGRVTGVAGTKRYADNLEHRRQQLCAMVENTLSTPLLPGMTLASVSAQHRLAELEFYFSLPQNIQYRHLDELLRQKFSSPAWQYRKPLSEDIAKYGFMNGKIDLVFKADGKYWLADWKTNSLGAPYRNYSHDALLASMVGSLYPVQAAIYTVALDRLLRQRLPDYCPEKHFGGVFYLYVRGMNCASADTGVFYLPYDSVFVNELKEIFPGGAV